MNHTDVHNLDELRRIKRVSDMMITAHAVLKERYRNISILSDVLLFSCAAILCTITFADRDLLIKYLSPRYNLYIGTMAIVSFIYSFVCNQLEWKVKAEKHKTAFGKYVNLKFECTNLLKKIDEDEQVDIKSFIEKYNTLTPTIIAIPENLFLKCKKHHVLKAYISKYLDEHQSSSILLLKIKLWLRDNCISFKNLKKINKN